MVSNKNLWSDNQDRQWSVFWIPFSARPARIPAPQPVTSRDCLMSSWDYFTITSQWHYKGFLSLFKFITESLCFIKPQCLVVTGHKAVSAAIHCQALRVLTIITSSLTWHISMTAVSCWPSSPLACSPCRSCWALLTATIMIIRQFWPSISHFHSFLRVPDLTSWRLALTLFAYWHVATLTTKRLMYATSISRQASTGWDYTLGDLWPDLVLWPSISWSPVAGQRPGWHDHVHSNGSAKHGKQTHQLPWHSTPAPPQ